MFSYEFCENSKNIFSCRTPPAAATVFISIFRLRFIKTYAYLQPKNTFKPDLIILLYKNSTKLARADTPEINQNAVTVKISAG